MADEVLVAVEAGIATVTLNRPDQRNAMNTALLQGLRSAIDSLDERRDVRVVVVKGAGPAFCSGMDLKEMDRRGGEADPEGNVVEVLRRVEASRHPTIAALHGDAIAGGCELALHCDLRVAAEPVRLGMPLARIGLVIPFLLNQKLVEIIGPAHTRHLLLTGQTVDARRAYEIGMVHQVVGGRRAARRGAGARAPHRGQRAAGAGRHQGEHPADDLGPRRHRPRRPRRGGQPRAHQRGRAGGPARHAREAEARLPGGVAPQRGGPPAIRPATARATGSSEAASASRVRPWSTASRFWLSLALPSSRSIGISNATIPRCMPAT